MAKHLFLVASAAVLLSASTAAQDLPAQPFSGLEKEHAFLKKFVGEWETKAQCAPTPDQPPVTNQGTMKARMLGERWVVVDSEITLMDAKVHALLTVGYDPQKKKYVGTWVDSMTNHLWQYEGAVVGQTLTLSAAGPDFFAPGKTANYQDIYEFKSAEEIAVTSKIQSQNGQWTTFMTGSAKRKPVSR